MLLELRHLDSVTKALKRRSFDDASVNPIPLTPNQIWKTVTLRMIHFALLFSSSLERLKDPGHSCPVGARTKHWHPLTLFATIASRKGIFIDRLVVLFQLQNGENPSFGEREILSTDLGGICFKTKEIKLLNTANKKLHKMLQNNIDNCHSLKQSIIYTS